MEDLTAWIVAYGEAHQGYKVASEIPARASYIAQQIAARKYAEEHLVHGSEPVTREDHEDGSVTWSKGCDRVYLLPLRVEI
tara:strand:+ start:380 stop:622 length:243 start_codon:yes stop_codon:yes gene_type:complete